MTYLIMNWWLNCKFKVPLKVKLYGCKEYWVGVSVMLCKSTFLSLSVHWNFVNCDSLKNISSILQPTGNGWKISRVFNIVLSWTVLYFELHSVIILFINVSKMMRIHMQKIVTKNILRDIIKYLTLLLWYLSLSNFLVLNISDSNRVPPRMWSRTGITLLGLRIGF